MLGPTTRTGNEKRRSLRRSRLSPLKSNVLNQSLEFCDVEIIILK